MSTALVALLPFAAGAQSTKAATGTKAGLDDATIVGIFDAANTWDISTGALASKKGTRQDVKDFGAMLARDHKSVQQQGRDLAKKLGVTPVAVASEFALKKDYDDTMKQLGGLSGAEFDAVTTQFLPAIKNAELKAFVEKVAPAFDAHMKAAQSLLTKK